MHSALPEKCSLVGGIELDKPKGSSDDSPPMPLIEIAPNKFINTDHVVTVTYEPAKTGTKEASDGSDYNLPKKVKAATPSSIKVILSNGEKVERKGQEANLLLSALTGGKE
jgi:hypothetical protein